MHPRGYGFPMTEEDKTLLERLDRARRQVAEPLELLRKNTNKTGEGQAIALYSFLENIGLPERLEERVAALRQREQPALAEEYRQLWEIICGGLEQCAQLLRRLPWSWRSLPPCSGWCCLSTTWAPSPSLSTG